VIKEIPQRRRPPEPIRDIKVKELKEKRPLRKRKEASVLKPSHHPRRLPVTPGGEDKGGATERDMTNRKGLGKPGPLLKKSEKPKEGRPREKGVGNPETSNLLKEELKSRRKFKPAEKGGRKTHAKSGTREG